jgi:hypothetical protein
MFATPSCTSTSLSDSAAPPSPPSIVSPVAPAPTKADGAREPGLSQSDRINLGVGLGVPIASMLIGILAWAFPRERRIVIKYIHIHQSAESPVE